MIRKSGSGYDVLSESGKRLGHYGSKEAAEKRLRQIEYFKHEDKEHEKRAAHHKKKMK